MKYKYLRYIKGLQPRMHFLLLNFIYLIIFIYNKSSDNINAKHAHTLTQCLLKSSLLRKTYPLFSIVPSSLYRFRLRNKKSSSVGRAFPLAPGVMGKTFTMEGSIHTDVSAGAGQGLKGTGENTTPLTEGVPSLTHPQLISRGADMMEETKRAVPNGSGGANGSNGLSGTSRNTSGSTEQ